MQKILFTGARSGIVNQVIEKLKYKDYYIYVTVHNDEQLRMVEEKYEGFKNIECFKLDVTNRDDISKLEGLDVDTVVVNSSIGYGGSIAEIDMMLVKENFEVNVFGNFQVVQSVLKNMIAKKKGKIILMSSLAAIFPVCFLGVYSATKASIARLGFALQKELKLISKDLHVSVIQPGFYHTGFNQVMFQNKYEWMDVDSYFSSCLDLIRKRDDLIERYIERKNLATIRRTIIKAIRSKNPEGLYRAPFSQAFFAKCYQTFFE